ncbi:hypothetical protein L6164_035439 [Bauhinia variegata]|uniref:Uncharacterized protein n=1 Tax=Bauhinia variegata TaxID=167791 RepID=A0ACB9KDY7_BAUVA|nr:hypothetical protein L6164_035439 [Bauhinia variegata]
MSLASNPSLLPNSWSTLVSHKNHLRAPIFIHTSTSTSHLRFFASTNVNVISHNPLPQRNSANYQPTHWTYDFLQSLKNDHYVDATYKERAMKLREDVRRMIKDENTAGLFTKLELIDDIQRLGLSYHFEKEIAEALGSFVSFESRHETTDRTLHEAALIFRLLREHGYDVSPDIFERFKEDKGAFKACLTKDVKGMLSLYEASFLGFEGEHILDEARSSTSMHLKQMIKEEIISKTLLEEVSHALELPIHHRIQRLETRWHIDAYSKRDKANPVLLEAAKLDFNIVQSTLRKDLQEMSRWWNGMGLAAKLSFSRDRLTECFFWTVGMAFEPQFSNLRKGLTKVTCLITTIDDVYDVYGTLDELELFTSSVERWDIKAMESLPEYMKMCFLALYNTVNEMAYEVFKEHGHYILPYLTKAWADMLKAFLQEAKWQRDKDLPTFEDYLNNAWVSVSGVVILVHSYFMLNHHSITKEALDSLQNHHNLLRTPSTIFRLCNDLGTSTAELQRGEAASSIVCYMNENGNSMSEECAYRDIGSLLDQTWKKMNKAGIVDSPFPKTFKDRAINLARISQYTYLNGDGHGAPDTTSENRIRSLIIEPITLNNTI